MAVSEVMEIRKKLMALDDRANELWYDLKSKRINGELFAREVRIVNEARWDLIEQLAKLTESGKKPFGD